jgi:hypothetical protein
MKNFVLGFALACAVSSWAVTRHDDGSLTLDREEVDTLRLQFYNMQMIAQQCAVRAQQLEEENARLNKGRI